MRWLWLWLEGLRQKRAERRLAKLEAFANTLIRTEDVELARSLGIVPVVQMSPEMQAALGDMLRERMRAEAQHTQQYSAQLAAFSGSQNIFNTTKSGLGAVLGTIVGGPIGGALGQNIGSMIGNGRRVQ